jgi:hypothetical protein
MGAITIKTAGSFNYKEKSFTAMDNGHTDAVAQAIEWLSSELLPEANALDHRLHDSGDKPKFGFDRKDNPLAS